MCITAQLKTPHTKCQKCYINVGVPGSDILIGGFYILKISSPGSHSYSFNISHPVVLVLLLCVVTRDVVKVIRNNNSARIDIKIVIPRSMVSIYSIYIARQKAK